MHRRFYLISLISFLPFILLAFLPRPVHADYNSTYQDYVYNYELYRNALSDYQIAKSTYQTYRTLTAQNDAITKFRSVLKTRDQVMVVYYSLLQEKSNSTTGVQDDTKKTFSQIKTSQRAWLSSHQTKIDAASTFDDLNSVSSEFESRYPQMDTETKQAIGSVLIAKETTLRSRLDNLLGQLTDKIAQIRSGGENTQIPERGIVSAKSKLDLYTENLALAQNVFFPTDSNSNSLLNLFDGQQKLTHTNQYLRETVAYLLEIIKGITG